MIDDIITYRAVRGGLHPDGGVVERTIPGEKPGVIETLNTFVEAEARADELNAVEAAKEAQQ